MSTYRLLEPLHEGVTSTVYRAVRQAGGEEVVLKLLRPECIGPREREGLSRELEIVRRLDLDGVIAAHGIHEVDGRPALVLDDFGGESLRKLLKSRKLTLLEFLRTARSLARTLGEIHRRKIVHHDLNPEHIILNPGKGTVKITDFGLASGHAEGIGGEADAQHLPGTLTYLSPERTGRVNRTVDYRTDFYSLGATFYEMLLGWPPFQTDDPLEMIHAHIAKKPTPPDQLNRDIPKAVSDIILKLLAKNPEERYKSAFGLQHDLDLCLRRVERGESFEGWTAGAKDVSDQFQIPEALYGRARELEALLAAFERVRLGPSELLLVSGFSGTGKSALIREVHKPTARNRGFFVTGKFDQSRLSTPYASLIQAFQSLIRGILSESEAAMAYWREALSTELSSNGQVMIDVIPEVELILGKQPPALTLGPEQSQNRFNYVFQKFIGVFAKKDHPLSIFLDDLQWADSGSLKLMQVLLTDPDSRHLLLIGSYRVNEVHPGHPLQAAVAGLTGAGARVNEISIGPLPVEEVERLLCDVFSCDPAAARPLAEVVQRRTEGNPFFIKEFLRTLHQEGLLTFDPASGWRWDLDKVRGVGITENVVELLAGKIQRLTDEGGEVLKRAACLGAEFDLRDLAHIGGRSVAETAASLWEAVRQALVLPLGRTFRLFESIQAPAAGAEVSGESLLCRFSHDRVQSAALTLLTEAERQAGHLAVARLWLHRAGGGAPEEKIFEIAGHFSLARPLLTDRDERRRVADLQLKAGIKAKSSTAYEEALGFYSSGLGLLDGDPFQSDYVLAFSLSLGRVECEYLTGRFEEAEGGVETLLRAARTPLDQARVYSMIIVLLENRSRYREAIARAAAGLRLFGVRLSQKPGRILLVRGLIKTRLGYRRSQIGSLAGLPKLSDPLKQAPMEMMLNLFAAAYFTDQNLLGHLVLKMVDHSFHHGNSPASALAYGFYGLVLGVQLGDYDSALEFGRLSLKLNQAFGDEILACKVNVIFGAFINPWKNHAHTSRPYFDAAIAAGLKSGDYLYTGYAVSLKATTAFVSGERLSLRLAEAAKDLSLLRRTRYEANYHYYLVLVRIFCRLSGRQPDAQFFEPAYLNEEDQLDMLRGLFEKGQKVPFNLYHIFLQQVLYFEEDFPGSLAAAATARRDIAANLGLLQVAEHRFYHGLAAAAAWDAASAGERRGHRRALRSALRHFHRWARHCPENFSARRFLLQGEWARISGREAEAFSFYGEALREAVDRGALPLEALANEMIARAYFSRGNEALVRAPLSEAIATYEKWGALPKAARLKRRHARLLPASREGGPKKTSHLIAPNEDGLSGVDFLSVLKASQALSGEIILGQLLENLMGIVIENAGAERGFLVLEHDGKLFVEAGRDVGSAEAATLQSLPLDSHAGLSVRIVQYVARTREDLVLPDAAREGLFTHDAYVVKAQPRSVLCLPLLNQGQLTGVLYLENNLAARVFTPQRIEVLKMLSAQAAISIHNARLYGNLTDMANAFARFVPVQFLEFLDKKSILHVGLGDAVQKRMTVLFSDIRDFTKLSERLDVNDNFRFLNSYLKRMGPVIDRHDGFIDKYIGDAIMALFAESPRQAIRAAVDMQREVAAYNRHREKSGYAPIATGIGLNTGALMLGTVGSRNRLDTTVIGDTVNLAARLQSLTKAFGASVVVSDPTVKSLTHPEEFQLRPIATVRVKGKQTPVDIYEAVDADPPALAEKKGQLSTLFAEGLAGYKAGHFADGRKIFERALSGCPDDRVSEFYVARCRHYELQPPGPEWAGVSEV